MESILTLTWDEGKQSQEFDLDEFFPCKAGKWDVLVQMFKRASNEVEVYENLIPYMYSRIGRLAVEKADTEANMQKGNIGKSKRIISHCNAEINWFTRRVKLLERLLQTA